MSVIEVQFERVNFVPDKARVATRARVAHQEDRILAASQCLVAWKISAKY